MGIWPRSLARRPANATLRRYPRAIPNFLPQLPAELRNNIYAIALADSLPNGNDVSFYKGLTGVCKQIRAEFWPLFWRRANLYVTSDLLPAVLKTFFSRTAADTVYPRSVTVTVDCTGTGYRVYVDLLPLLQAKPVCPETRWSFVASESTWLQGKAEWRKEVVESYLIPRSCMNPDAMAAADCGLLKEVYIELFAKRRQVKWLLIVQTEDGRLSTKDRLYSERCCRDLRAFDRFRYFDNLPQFEQEKKVTVLKGFELMEIYN